MRKAVRLGEVSQARGLAVHAYSVVAADEWDVPGTGKGAFKVSALVQHVRHCRKSADSNWRIAKRQSVPILN